MKQFVKKKVSFVMVMIMAVITVISMSLPMAVFAQGGGYTPVSYTHLTLPTILLV